MKIKIFSIMLLISLLTSLMGTTFPAVRVSANAVLGPQVWYITDILELSPAPGSGTGSSLISPPQTIPTSSSAAAAMTIPAGHWIGYISLSSSYSGGANIRIGYGAGETVTYGGTQTLPASTYQNGFNLDIDANSMSLAPGDAIYLKFDTGTPTILTGGSCCFISSPSGSPFFPDPAQTQKYGLTMSSSGNGDTMPPVSNTAYDFFSGTVVPLSATPAAGFHFSGWSGSITGAANPTTVTINGALNIQADFVENSSQTYSLTLAVSPEGAGTTVPAIGAHVYDAGEVSINATAASGYTFVNWTGAGIANPNASGTTVALDGNKTITAHFALNNPVNLVLSPSADAVMIGDTFEVDILARSGSQPVVGMDAYLDFDPAILSVVDMDSGAAGTQITGGQTLTSIIVNSADNTFGQLDYCAGVLGGEGISYPSGNFTIATIHFLALAETSPTTAVTFSTSLERDTEVSGDILGTDVTGTLTGETYTVLSGINVDISVGLQGASRPDNAWIIPLTVKFFTPGADVLTADPLYSFSLTTTKVNSAAVIQCTGIPGGSYDISAFSSHTLVNVRRNVTIDLSTTGVSLGTLLEGNANNDIRINIADFSILSGSYNRASADQGYNAMADFDGSGVVNIADFSLLSGNYNRRSPIEVP